MAQEPEDGVDDYMSMTFADEAPAKTESSIQRRARRQREAEKKSRPKSKAEVEAEEAAARELALATSLDPSNKGFKMMEKLGFTGGALGKEGRDDARTEPVGLVLKEDRGGIGLESEKKRKFREEVGNDQKKVKVDEGDFRERMKQEKEEKRLEGQVIGAMVVAERLDEATASSPNVEVAEQNSESNGHSVNTERAKEGVEDVTTAKPLRSINVLWRNLAKHRLEKERDRRMRYDLEQSLTRRPTYDDPDEDKYDKQALGREEEELEEEDQELEEFSALPPQDRLSKILVYLREVHHYCFWCKFQYPSAEMDGCPGITEEDHD